MVGEKIVKCVKVNLKRKEKNSDFYLSKFPEDKGFNDSKYFWPVNETITFKMI